MDNKATSLETPTLIPIQIWQLPRRFDAVIWFVRLQRENPSYLNDVFVLIPYVGPAILQIKENTPCIQHQLGHTGETFIGTDNLPWQAHSLYLESLGDWLGRHALDWPSSASISWLLSLHRDAWLAVANTWLNQEDTTWLVKSAWLTLALGSADLDLLALIPDNAYEHVHAQVYADEITRSLQWLSSSYPGAMHSWLQALLARSFFKLVWSRVPLYFREKVEQQFPDLFVV